MKKEDWMAYCAGLIDGDGSLSLIKKPSKASPLYYPYVQFGSACEGIVQFLKNQFGGFVHHRKGYAGKDGSSRQDFYTWKLEKKASKDFLKFVKDYLVIKKDRANLLLEYFQNHPFVRGSNRLSQEEVDKREKTYIQMISMNKNAVIHTSEIIPLCKKASDDSVVWAYIAGIMDTDGSFSLRSKYLAPVINLSMVDMRAIYFIRKHVPWGHFNCIIAKGTQVGKCYRFQISSRLEAIEFLKQILPYLQIKNPVATFILSQLENMNCCQYRRGSLSDEELLLRKTSSNHVMYLNKTQHGVYKPSLIDLEVLEQDDRAQAGECRAG